MGLGFGFGLGFGLGLAIEVFSGCVSERSLLGIELPPADYDQLRGAMKTVPRPLPSPEPEPEAEP